MNILEALRWLLNNMLNLFRITDSIYNIGSLELNSNFCDIFLSITEKGEKDYVSKQR